MASTDRASATPVDRSNLDNNRAPARADDGHRVQPTARAPRSACPVTLAIIGIRPSRPRHESFHLARIFRDVNSITDHQQTVQRPHDVGTNLFLFETRPATNAANITGARSEQHVRLPMRLWGARSGGTGNFADSSVSFTASATGSPYSPACTDNIGFRRRTTTASRRRDARASSCSGQRFYASQSTRASGARSGTSIGTSMRSVPDADQRRSTTNSAAHEQHHRQQQGLACHRGTSSGDQLSLTRHMVVRRDEHNNDVDAHRALERIPRRRMSAGPTVNAGPRQQAFARHGAGAVRGNTIGTPTNSADCAVDAHNIDGGDTQRGTAWRHRPAPAGPTPGHNWTNERTRSSGIIAWDRCDFIAPVSETTVNCPNGWGRHTADPTAGAISTAAGTASGARITRSSRVPPVGTGAVVGSARRMRHRGRSMLLCRAGSTARRGRRRTARCRRPRRVAGRRWGRPRPSAARCRGR